MPGALMVSGLPARHGRVAPCRLAARYRDCGRGRSRGRSAAGLRTGLAALNRSHRAHTSTSLGPSESGRYVLLGPSLVMNATPERRSSSVRGG